MNEMQVTTRNNVAGHLRKLARLYQQQQASETMTRGLDKLLHYEAEFSQEQIGQLQRDMREFEEKYGLSSAEFYQRFQAGETDDRMDYVEWASMAQMAQNLEARLELLTSA